MMVFSFRNQATLLDKVMELQDGLVSESTGGAFPGFATSDNDDYVNGEARYSKLRDELLFAPETNGQLPDFVRGCFSLDAFRRFIRGEIEDFSARRHFLWDSFRPLLSSLRDDPIAPAGTTITSRLESLRAGLVQETWAKALSRRKDDPEGAITAALTLLETVCRHLIEKKQPELMRRANSMAVKRKQGRSGDRDKSRKLYGECVEALNLTPDQQTKEILGNCSSIIGGLAHLRNAMSDAHGRGSNFVKPASRYAELAVNLAGSVAAFLVATWRDEEDEKFPF